MEERKIRGRSRRRKYKNQMRRPIAVLLALMLSFSSFGTATAYADAAEGSKTESQPEKMESEKWTEKTILDSGKQTDGVSVTRDASANAANEGKETGNDNEGGNDDGQTDGKTDNPYDSIERPAQSDTIEMIPGAPSDSKDKESDSGTDTQRPILPKARIRSQGQQESRMTRMNRKKRVNPKISRREVKKPR